MDVGMRRGAVEGEGRERERARTFLPLVAN